MVVKHQSTCHDISQLQHHFASIKSKKITKNSGKFRYLDGRWRPRIRNPCGARVRSLVLSIKREHSTALCQFLVSRLVIFHTAFFSLLSEMFFLLFFLMLFVCPIKICLCSFGENLPPPFPKSGGGRQLSVPARSDCLSHKQTCPVARSQQPAILFVPFFFSVLRYMYVESI